MADILLAKYNDNEVNLHLEASEFNPGQSKYHVKWTINFNDQEQYWEYEIPATTEQLPALRFGYRNMDVSGAGIYYSISTAPEMRIFSDIALGVSTGVNNGLDTVNAVKIDEGGMSLVANPTWRGLQKQFFGTVSECNLDIYIKADFPIFCTDWALDTNIGATGDAYKCTSISDDNARVTNCVSGDMSDAEEAQNYATVVNTIPRDKIYFIKNILKKNGTVVSSKHYRFKVPPSGKLYFIANQHDNTGQTFNMSLYAYGLGLPPTFLWQVGGSGTSWTTAHLLTTELSRYYYGEWTDYSNGDYYKTVGTAPAGYTNIPIFADEDTADKYIDGLIGEDAAINSGDLGYDGKITTGDDLSSSDIPSPVIAGSGAGVNVWLLDKGNLNAIFANLYDDTQTVIDDIKDGTWLWGNNPIDVIVSIYYVPFDVSNFYDTRTERVWLGHYDTGLDYTQAKETKSSGQRITLVNQTIDQVYGDWRDLDFFKYELFLPYIGFVPLDPQIYVGHTLTIELAFDVMTHNIRYYLFSDGIVTDRVDGSVGYAIPVTGTDMVNKANQNISGIVNTVKGGAELIGGVATGNLGMGATGALDTFNGIRNMMSYPKEIIRGDISASMNIFDINYAYLKITEKQSIYPSAIRRVYNNPSYVCCKLSDLLGYCELQDVQLTSSCTKQEYDEIIQLLKEGVIFS